MGRFISILSNTSVIKKKTASLRHKLSASQLDAVMKAKAEEIRTFMVANTPVGKFNRGGTNTRDSWVIRKNAEASYSVRNYKKTMLFLEYGTKTPIVPVSAKRLYIPLTQAGYDSYRSRMAYKQRAARAERRGLPVPQRRQGEKLRYGRDYILVKQAKGIAALNLRKKVKPAITNIFIKSYLKGII